MRFSRLRSMVRRFRSSQRVEQDLRDDIRGYADQLADERVAAGMDPIEARRLALVELGGITSVEESVRSARSGAALEQWWQDVRYAIRGLRRTPAFAATVIITLGLGIGVNTSVFTVLNAALLKPLPYDRPEELIEIGHRVRIGTAMEGSMFGLSFSEIALWRAETQLIQQAEATTGRPVARVWRERDQPINVGQFTSGLPTLLGIVPRIGRVFSMEEVEQRAPVLVISDQLWSHAFGRRVDALGSTMTVDGTAMTIIGVMPPAFRYGPGGSGSTDAWTGLSTRRDPAVPGSGMGSPVFRLRTGLSLEAAQPIAAAVAARIQQAEPDSEPWTPALVGLMSGQHNTRSRLYTPLTLLLAATGLVLLVACANVANLLSARNGGRRHELSMRAALGASRSRLARLLLAEGFLIAAIGSGVAIVVAKGTIQALLVLMPKRMLMGSGLFSVSLPEIDWRVLSFTIGATAIVTLLSALWPAVRGSKVGQLAAMSENNRLAGSTPERRRMSTVLQSIQVALALVLATGAGLFASSLSRILSADLGFDPKGLVNVTAQLPSRYKSPESRLLAFEEALERVRAIPGVQAAAIGNPPPATTSGRLIRSGEKDSSGIMAIRYASPGYFATAGIRLVAGRDFGPEDLPDSPAVAIIDDVGARAVFGNDSPIGQRFKYSPYAPEMTIIGVASAVAGSGFVTSKASIGMYFAQNQSNRSGASFIIRTTADEAPVLRAVRDGIQAVDPLITITKPGPVTDYYDQMETYSTPTFYLSLISLFAALALVTAAAGLYGLLAYAVGQRQREIGVRVALGSTTSQIRWMVLSEAMRPTLAGLVMGVIGSWLAAGVLRSFLYEVSPHDLPTFVWSAALLLVVVLVATIGPIRRATGVDPIRALRAE